MEVDPTHTSDCWIPLGSKECNNLVITNNLSTVDWNQQLLVRFPNLAAHDMVLIVMGMAHLACTISLTFALMPTGLWSKYHPGCDKTIIKMSGNEVLFTDDSNLWKTAGEHENIYYQSIDTTCNKNATLMATELCRHLVYLWQMLSHPTGPRAAKWRHLPFYQNAMDDWLEYELTFSGCSCMILQRMIHMCCNGIFH